MAKRYILLLLTFVLIAVKCKTITFYPQFNYVYNYATNLTTKHENGNQSVFGLQFQFKIIPRNKDQYVVLIKDPKLINSEAKFYKIDDLLHPFLVEKSDNENEGVAYKIRLLDENESMQSQNIKKSIVSLIEVKYEKQDIQYPDYYNGILGRCFTTYSVIERETDAKGRTRTELQRIRDLKDCFGNDDIHDYYSFNALRMRYNLFAKGSKHTHYSLIEENDNVFITSAHSDEYVKMVYNKITNLTDPIISTQKLELLERFEAQSDKESILFEKLLHGFETSVTGNITKERVNENIEDIVNAFNEILDTFYKLKDNDLDELRIFPKIHKILDQISHLKVNELKKIFNHNNMTEDYHERTGIFFSILSLSNNFEAFQAVMELTKDYFKNVSSTEFVTSLFQLQMAKFFSSQRIRFHSFTKEMGLYFLDFCNEVLVKSDPILRKNCYLSLSRTIDMNCENTYLVAIRSKVTCGFRDYNDLFEKVIENAGFNFTDSELVTKEPEELILAVQTFANFKLKNKAHDQIDRILSNKAVNIDVRTIAAWSLVRVENFYPQKYVSMLLDRSEHYEIRIAIFHNILLRRPALAEPFIKALKDDLMNKRFKENKNLLIAVYGMLKQRAKASENEHCFDQDNSIKEFYNELNESVEKYFGTVEQQFASGFGYSKSKIYLAKIPNDASFLPRSVYLRQIDPFLEEAFVVRSENGFGFNQHTVPLSAKDGKDRNAQETLSKIINYFQNEINASVTTSPQFKPNFEVVHLLDRYCMGFVYKSNGKEIDAKEWTAFKGFNFRTDINFNYMSITESGFSFENKFLQTRIIQNNFNLSPRKGYNGFNGVGALSKTVGFLPLSNHLLTSGKGFEKYFRLNYPVELKINSFQQNNISLNLKIDLPSTQNQSYDIFYEELGSFNFQTLFDDSKTSYSNSAIKEKQTSIEEYFGVEMSIITPLGRPKPKLTWQRALLEYDASQALLPSNFGYKIKAYLPVRERQRDFDIGVKHFSDQTNGQTSIEIKNGEQKICKFEYNQKLEEQNYRKNYEIKENINIWNISTKTMLAVTFPPKNVYATKVHEIEDAIISGKYYFSKNENESFEDDNNVAVLIDGKYSKKKDVLSLRRFQESLNRAEDTLDKELRYKVLDEASTYNRLELNYNIINDLMKEDKNIAAIHNVFAESMIKKFTDHIKVDLLQRTDNEKNVKLVIDTYPYEYNTLSDLTTTNHYATVSYKAINAKVIPKLMPYTNFFSRSNPNYWLFNNELHSCELQRNSIRTFDGNVKYHSKSIPLTKLHLFAADCKTSRFAAFGNDNHLRILFNGYYDIVIQETSIQVNGNNISIGVNELKNIGPISLIAFETNYFLKFPFGGEIIVRPDRYVFRVSPIFKGSLCGVCGDFDGNWSNDFKAPNGTNVNADKIYETWIYEL